MDFHNVYFQEHKLPNIAISTYSYGKIYYYYNERLYMYKMNDKSVVELHKIKSCSQIFIHENIICSLFGNKLTIFMNSIQELFLNGIPISIYQDEIGLGFVFDNSIDIFLWKKQALIRIDIPYNLRIQGMINMGDDSYFLTKNGLLYKCKNIFITQRILSLHKIVININEDYKYKDEICKDKEYKYKSFGKNFVFKDESCKNKECMYESLEANVKDINQRSTPTKGTFIGKEQNYKDKDQKISSAYENHKTSEQNYKDMDQRYTPTNEGFAYKEHNFKNMDQKYESLGGNYKGQAEINEENSGCKKMNLKGIFGHDNCIYIVLNGQKPLNLIKKYEVIDNSAVLQYSYEFKSNSNIHIKYGFLIGENLVSLGKAPILVVKDFIYNLCKMDDRTIIGISDSKIYFIEKENPISLTEINKRISSMIINKTLSSPAVKEMSVNMNNIEVPNFIQDPKQREHFLKNESLLRKYELVLTQIQEIDKGIEKRENEIRFESLKLKESIKNLEDKSNVLRIRILKLTEKARNLPVDGNVTNLLENIKSLMNDLHNFKIDKLKELKSKLQVQKFILGRNKNI